jgi:hypothetical protein
VRQRSGHADQMRMQLVCSSQARDLTWTSLREMTEQSCSLHAISACVPERLLMQHYRTSLQDSGLQLFSEMNRVCQHFCHNDNSGKQDQLSETLGHPGRNGVLQALVLPKVQCCDRHLHKRPVSCDSAMCNCYR